MRRRNYRKRSKKRRRKNKGCSGKSRRKLNSFRNRKQEKRKICRRNKPNRNKSRRNRNKRKKPKTPKEKTSSLLLLEKATLILVSPITNSAILLLLLEKGSLTPLPLLLVRLVHSASTTLLTITTDTIGLILDLLTRREETG